MEKSIVRIKHILEAITRIEFITNSINFDQFFEDWIKQDAAIKNFQVIGEATKNLDEEIISKYPEVAWRQAKGMRNIVVHEYFGINIEYLWNTIQENLPTFKTQIEQILNDLEKNNNI